MPLRDGSEPIFDAIAHPPQFSPEDTDPVKTKDVHH